MTEQTTKTFMRAMEDEGEYERFEPFLFEGYCIVPYEPNGVLVRVAAYVDEDRNYGLMFIYKKKGD